MLKYFKQKKLIFILLLLCSFSLALFSSLLYPGSPLTSLLAQIKLSLGKKAYLDVEKWRNIVYVLSALSIFGSLTLPYLLSSDTNILTTFKKLLVKIAWGVIPAGFTLTFLSSLATVFLTHSFADGWWTSTAELLNNSTRLYRDVNSYTTPLRILIAYYLNFFGIELIWEKIFGFGIICIIYTGLIFINLSLTKNILISLAFATISIALGQSYFATNYYDYHLISVMLMISIIVLEIRRLNRWSGREVNSQEYLLMYFIGLLMGFNILNRYTDGFIFFIIILVYFIVFYWKQIFLREVRTSKWRLILLNFTLFSFGNFSSFIVLWLLGHSIIDFSAMSSNLISSTEAKGLTIYSLTFSTIRYISVLINSVRDKLKFDLFNPVLIEDIFLLILPLLLAFNIIMAIRSLYHEARGNFSSASQKYTCFLVALLGGGLYISNLLSCNGEWISLPYFYNVIPLAILNIIPLKNIPDNLSYLKIVGLITSFLTIPFSFYKILHPLQWSLPLGEIRLNNFTIPQSGYYSYLPIEKKYNQLISNMCSALVDKSALVISYPVPLPNLACDRKFPLQQNVFWYDVTNSSKVRYLLSWLQKKHNSSVYVIFVDGPFLKQNERIYGPKPGHRELESYLRSQDTLSRNSQYVLIRDLPYATITRIKIYQSNGLNNLGLKSDTRFSNSKP